MGSRAKASEEEGPGEAKQRWAGKARRSTSAKLGGGADGFPSSRQPGLPASCLRESAPILAPFQLIPWALPPLGCRALREALPKKLWASSLGNEGRLRHRKIPLYPQSLTFRPVSTPLHFSPASLIPGGNPTSSLHPDPTSLNQTTPPHTHPRAFPASFWCGGRGVAVLRSEEHCFRMESQAGEGRAVVGWWRRNLEGGRGKQR